MPTPAGIIIDQTGDGNFRFYPGGAANIDVTGAVQAAVCTMPEGIAGLVIEVAPSVTSNPTVTGSTTVGSILGGLNGTATGNPTPAPSIAWERNGTIIPGQNGSTLPTTGFAVGDQIVRVVTWSAIINGQTVTAVARSEPFILTKQPTLQIESVTPNPIVAGQPFTVLFDVAPDTVTSNAPLTGTGLTRSGVGPSDPAVDVTITPAKAGYTTVPRVFDVVAAPDVLELTSREYPTDVGTITYNVSSQFSGTVTNWSVAGSPHATISNGIVSIDTDDVADGMLELEITATGAVKPVGKLTLFFSPITMGYDGEFISTISYPDDTPADVDITYTPVGGLHDGRVITFTPADLEGLVDGESFFALPPVVSISTDTAPTGSVNAGDVLSLDKPALQIFTGDTTPALIYSARGSNGWTMNNITFPFTVPAGPTGSLVIRASDGLGNSIDSTSFPGASTTPLADGLTVLGLFSGTNTANQKEKQINIDLGPADPAKKLIMFIIGGPGTMSDVSIGAGNPKIIKNGVEYPAGALLRNNRIWQKGRAIFWYEVDCPAGGAAVLDMTTTGVNTYPWHAYLIAVKDATKVGTSRPNDESNAQSLTAGVQTSTGRTTQVGDHVIYAAIHDAPTPGGMAVMTPNLTERFDAPVGDAHLIVGTGTATVSGTTTSGYTPSVNGSGAFMHVIYRDNI